MSSPNETLRAYIQMLLIAIDSEQVVKQGRPFPVLASKSSLAAERHHASDFIRNRLLIHLQRVHRLQSSPVYLLRKCH
ncbi:hypothetical protein PSPO01_01120 [Paraphaeosphaeria sporulosa]